MGEMETLILMLVDVVMKPQTLHVEVSRRIFYSMHCFLFEYFYSTGCGNDYGVCLYCCRRLFTRILLLASPKQAKFLGSYFAELSES